MVYVTKGADETKEIGYLLAKHLDENGIRKKYIAMEGEMGVGKTAFVCGFASYFGITGVKSPTYTVVNEYGKSPKIFHFDMYRITDEDDLYSIGYDDYCEATGYIIVEWSENISDSIPKDAAFVTIERLPEDEQSRKITVKIQPDLKGRENK